MQGLRRKGLEKVVMFDEDGSDSGTEREALDGGGLRRNAAAREREFLTWLRVRGPVAPARQKGSE